MRVRARTHTYTHTHSCTHIYIHLTKEALEGFGDFKIGAQIICTVKYVHDMGLLAKEEITLCDKTDTLTGDGKC
jgi:hypothetical protein